MLLAAGLGTRLRPVTDRLAKPAVPFLNVPLFYWSLEFIGELKLDRVVANLHHLPETIRPLAPALRSPRQSDDFAIEFTFEEKAPLGSGGALWFAKKNLEDSETILVANADEVILPVHAKTLERMVQQHEATGALATLLTMRRPDAGTKFGGVWIKPDTKREHHAAGRVLGFGRDKNEFPEATEALHYVGVMLLNRRIFKYIPDGESNILYDAVTKAIGAGEHVGAFAEELVWYETGNPKDFLSASGELIRLLSPTAKTSLASQFAQRVLQKHAAPDTRLWESHNGASLLTSSWAKGSIPESAVCETLAAATARDASAVADRSQAPVFAVIGQGAQIQSSKILNSVILPGGHVAADQAVNDAIVVP